MKKYALKIIRDNLEIIPTWDVTFSRFKTLAYELVIDQYLPGSFDVWKIAFRDKCMTKYKNSITGEVAYCWLTKYGVPVDDFDEEDKPHRAPLTVFGNGKEIPCRDASMAARIAAQCIIDVLTSPHYAPARRAS